MEPILIFYQILSSGELSPPSLSEEYNCYELLAHSQKEVLLLDILTAWATWLPDLGTSFNFYTTYSPSNGASGGNFHHLASAASCVPVINQTIYLYLTPSAASLPFTPIEQALAFYDKSSREIYGTSSIISSGRPISSSLKRRGEGKGKSADDRPTVSRPSPVPQPQRLVPSSSPAAAATAPLATTSSAPKRSKPVAPSTEESDRPILPSRDRSLRPEKGSSPSTAAAQASSGATTAGLDIASIEAASQAGMEAAGVAARSFLNFAASTLMTVVNTSLSFTAGNILQVGDHRVTFIRDLAEGGFGKVCLVKDCSQPSPTIPVSSIGSYYAMKTLLCQTKEQLAEGINELKMLVMFRGHPNIVQLIDSSNTPVGKKNSNVRQLSFLFPLYHMGTCWDLIDTANNNTDMHSNLTTTWCFTEKQILEILMGTCRALESIHENNLIHFDMKPHNILLSDDMKPVVMDLGSMGPYRQVRSRRDALNLEEEAAIKCSAPYRAPELTQVSYPCDIGGWCDMWSLGCTMFALAFGRSPFESPKEGVLRLAIVNGKYSTPPGNSNMGITFSNDFISLMDSMLKVDYTLRPAAEEVKERIKEILDEQGGY